MRDTAYSLVGLDVSDGEWFNRLKLTPGEQVDLEKLPVKRVWLDERVQGLH